MCIRDSPRGPTSITGTARFISAIFYIASTPLSGHTPKSVGPGLEPCLPLRFQRGADHGLAAAVRDHRNTERALLSVALRYVHPSDGHRVGGVERPVDPHRQRGALRWSQRHLPIDARRRPAGVAFGDLPHALK